MDRASVASENYNHVRVLLLSWERASAAFDEQLLQLKEVFEQGFRFRAYKKLIPYENSHNQLSKTLCEFLDENDGDDTLLILYYGGHGTTDSDGNAVWTWMAICSFDRRDSPKVNWSHLQSHLFHREADILNIVDCCSAGSAVAERGEGFVEGIYATGVGGRTPVSGRNSFTMTLVNRLRQRCAEDEGISAYDLYHELTQKHNMASRLTGQSGAPPQYLQPAKRGNARFLRTARLRRMESFYTANDTISSLDEGLRREMMPGTNRASSVVETIDAIRHGTEVPVASLRNEQVESTQQTTGLDGYSIRHSLFRGWEGASRPSRPTSELHDTLSNLRIQDDGPPQHPASASEPTIDNNNVQVADYTAMVHADRKELHSAAARLSEFGLFTAAPGNGWRFTYSFDGVRAAYPKLTPGNDVRRLLGEMGRLIRAAAHSETQDFYSLLPVSDENILEWRATIKGPSGTPYDGGIFHLRLSMTGRDYPWEPPRVWFMTKIYHPNVNEQGAICADMLRVIEGNSEQKLAEVGGWSPLLYLDRVVVSICSLLDDPGWDEPLVPEIAAEYHRSPKLFEETAREWTKKYATGELVFPGDREDGYYNTVAPPAEE